MCLLQVTAAEWQRGGQHVGAQAPANTAANAASTLPTAVSASEPYLTGSKWQNPYAIMPTTLANASFASFSSSSTSSGHCLGPSGSVARQGPPSMPATAQSPHSAFNILGATPQAPNSAFNIPSATLTQPPTAEWGCIRPGHFSSQQLSSALHDQQSTQAPPLLFSTHQQCRTVPRQPLTSPRQFPSSLEQACLAAQQQHELLLRPPQQLLKGRQQSPTSSLVASQQLQHTWLRDAPALSLPRVDGTSSALFGTHHLVSTSGAHQPYNFRDGMAGADHASGLQPGPPCLIGGTQTLGQQLNYRTNLTATPYVPTGYIAHTASVQPRSSPALSHSTCTFKTGQQASQHF